MGNVFDLSILDYAEVGHLEGVKAYIARGGDVNKRDFYRNTALHRASCMGYTEIVRYLIQNGADVNAQAKDGWTPLHLAARWGRINVLRALVEAGAQKNITTDDGRTAGELLKVDLLKDDRKAAIDLLEYKPHSEDAVSPPDSPPGSLLSCISFR